MLRIQSSGKNRALVRFEPAEIVSTVGGGSLAEARLELFIETNPDNWGSSGRTVDAHRLLEDWTEEGATWNCGIDPVPGNGQAECAEEWSGGTFEEEPTDTVLHQNDQAGWVSFDVTADVLRSLDGEPDFGWLVKKTEEGQNGKVEYTSRQGVVGFEPRLVLVVESATFDEVPPKIAVVEPAGDVIVNDTTPQVVVEYSDGGMGINPSSLVVLVDTTDVSGSCSVGPSTAICESAPLAAGQHTVSVSVSDHGGNSAQATHGFELFTGPGLHIAGFEAVADTYLRSGSPNQNQGTEPILRVRSSGKNRALVRFDDAVLRSTLAAATLQSAHLELAIAKNGDNWGPEGRTVDAHKVTVPWSEDEATWNCAVDSDPTNQKPDCSPQWNGGSVEVTPSATVLHTKGLRGIVRYDVTADVAAILSGEDHYGWLLKKTNEGQSGLVEYRSREDVAGPAPRLVVVFETTVEEEVLPPDPATVAPPLTPETAVDLFASSSFLWEGADPVQTNVVPGAILPERICLVRGRVLAPDGSPLPGVRITVHGQPEVGQTLSREDGVFDIALNGGFRASLRYEKDEYLDAYRSIEVPAKDWAEVDDVVLVQLDPKVTEVAVGMTEMQVARGSVVTDVDGTRQATMLFPSGVTAAMTLPDGSSQPLSVMNVRVTEYSVGPLGPQRMPAELPENTGYNYAFEVSVDEALAAGAGSVDFSEPVIYYVEDFVGFPVGINVPSGSFDPSRAVWVPEPDGRSVQVLSVSSGVAELDIEGLGQAATTSELDELGVSTAERQRLASLYQPGEVLWRVELSHFSAYDFNWPYGPPDDAVEPPSPESDPVAPDNPVPADLPADDTGTVPDPYAETECGSILNCSSRSLREVQNLVGIPHQLYWASDRVRGNNAALTFKVRLTEDSIPDSLTRITLRLSVQGHPGGHLSLHEYPPAADLEAQITWPAFDRFSRSMTLNAAVRAELCHYYRPQSFVSRRRDYEASFSRFASGGNSLASSSRRTAEIRICRVRGTPLGRLIRPTLGGWDGSSAGLGGWTLGDHHRYNPTTGTLFLGDGTRRLVRPLDSSVSRFAGTGQYGDSGDGGRAQDAEISFPSDIAFAPDGSVLIADSGAARVRRVDATGTISTFAGTGSDCSQLGCGDGGPATEAELGLPVSIAIDRDNSILIGDAYGCIRRVDAAGLISTVIGDCYQGPSQIGWPADLLVGSGGGLYIADAGWNQVRYLGTDDVLTPLAGNTGCGSTVPGIPALTTPICQPSGLAFDANGEVLVAGGYAERILRIQPDGTLENVAGTGSSGFSGDGGLATSARLNAPFGIAAESDGSFLIADTFNGRIRRVSPGGRIESLTGGWDGEDLYNGMPPERLFTGFAEKVAIAPDHRIFLADTWDPQVLVIGESAAIRQNDEYWIPSEDGAEVFVFDKYGIHQRTVNPLTGATLLAFAYDSGQRLVSIADFDGNVTLIERSATGTPLAIVGPYGQQTDLTLDAAGYLAAVSNPAGEVVSYGYSALGLVSRTDARLATKTISYDVNGKLRQDSDPVGGYKRLTGATSNLTTSRVELQTALGRLTDYEYRLDSEAEVRWTRHRISASDVVSSKFTRFRGGGTEASRPDGTIITSSTLADPVWGPLVRPSDRTEVRTPVGNLGPTTTRSETATLSNPSDPLSLIQRASQVRVNNRLYTAAFDRPSLMWTFATPAGRVSTIQVDEAGRPIASQVGDLEPVEYAYDSRGRLSFLSQGAGAEERRLTFAYDGSGRIETVTDPLFRQVIFDYDSANRMTSKSLPGSRTVLFDWDANGNLIALTPPGRPSHVFSYTPVDLPESYDPPDVGIGSVSTLYSWNLDRNSASVERPNGTSIDFAYDAGQRPVAVTSPRGSQTVAYEPNTGRLQSVTTPEGLTLSYSYDGPLVRRTTWSGNGISGRVDRSYDDDLRLKTISVNGAKAITYSYDADSLIVQAGSMTLTRDTETGLLIGTTLGNVTTSYTYNGFGELASMDARFGASLLYQEIYLRDPLGRISTRQETIEGVTTVYEYGYDGAGRLETVMTNGELSAQYVYDVNGNRLSKWTPTSVETGAYDDQDRMLEYGDTTYTYTANGEVATKTDSSGTTSYSYDVFGNLLGVALPDGRSVQYKVDGSNRRIERSVDGTVEWRLLYQGRLAPIAELSATNGVVGRFVYATRPNSPDYVIRSGSTYRLVTDHLGSARMAVNVLTGAVVQRTDFDEWGAGGLSGQPIHPFGYAGGLSDASSGVVRFGARDYMPTTGRWTSKDPLRFGGGSANLYEYSSSNPINFFDPTGLEKIPVCAQRALAPHFPGLDLRDVELHDKIPALVEKFAAVNPDAFTFGQHIYFDGSIPDFGTRSDFKLLAHELTHTEQYQDDGVLFPLKYIDEYLKNKAEGMSDRDAYESNPYEEDARRNADEISDALFEEYPDDPSCGCVDE